MTIPSLPITEIVVAIFCLAFIVQMYYYLYLYVRVAFFKSNKDSISSTEPISVIICARNEAANLEKNLPYVLTQDYPNYEVIVVNDASTDNTEEVLHKLKQKSKRLRFTSLSEDKKFTHGKKLAQTVGIKAALSEWLLFTDADCRPCSKYWIRSMSEKFLDEKEITLSYGGYERKKGFLNSIIRYDTVQIAIQYLSYALVGNPYMGIGRNMAYRKSLFFSKKGFAGYAHILSGDDDLFVNKNATKHNTAVQLRQDAYTMSTPKMRWKEWTKQKRRHLSTGVFYKFKHKFALFNEQASKFIFIASAIYLFTQNIHITLVASLFAARYLIHLIVFKLCMWHLREKFLLLNSIIYELILPFINFVLICINKISPKKNKWI